MDLYKCRVCMKNFNLGDRLPRLMMNCCGENVCSDCLTNILQDRNQFRCPFDGTPYVIIEGNAEAFTINPTLKRLLEHKEGKELCKDHQEELRFKCLADNQTICDTCIQVGKHNGHNLISLKQLFSQGLQRKAQIEAKIKELEGQDTEMDKTFKENSNLYSHFINKRFQEIHKRLDVHESKILSDMHVFFFTERSRAKETTGANAPARTKAIELISSFKKLGNKELSHKFKKEISDTLSDLDDMMLKFSPKIYSRTLSNLINSFDSSLALQIEPFFQTNFTPDIDARRMDINIAKKIKKESGTEYNQSKSHNNLLIEASHDNGVNPNNRGSINLIPNTSISTRLKSLPNFKQNNHAPSSSSRNADTFLNFSIKDDCLLVSAKNIIVKNETSSDSPLDPAKWKNMSKICFKLGGYQTDSARLDALNWVCSQFECASSYTINFPPPGISDGQFNTIIPIIFKKAHRMKKLAIDLRKCKIGDESLQFLTDRYINKLVKIKDLHMNFNSTLVTHKSIRPFLSSLKLLMKNLKELKLFFAKTKFEDQNSSQLISGSDNLKVLILNFYSTKLTNSAMEALFKSTLAGMRSLKELEMNLNHTSLSDATAMSILTSLPNLKSLTLELERNNISNDIFGLFTKKFLPNLTSLESLDLNLKGTRITDVSVNALFAQIEKLRLFRINLDEKQAKNSSLKILGDKLNTMKHLEDFSLDIESTQITDEGLENVFVILPNVKVFSLNVAETGITSKSLKAFVEKTLPFMRVLKSFKMNLSKTKVTDVIINRLLTEMKPLKAFELNLSYTNISDVGVQLFTRSIKDILKYPSEFELDITNTKVSQGLQREINDFKQRINQSKYRNSC